MGPNLKFFFLSVMFGIGLGPFFKITSEIIDKSGPNIHPLTDFLFFCPFFNGLNHLCYSESKSLTLPFL